MEIELLMDTSLEGLKRQIKLYIKQGYKISGNVSMGYRYELPHYLATMVAEDVKQLSKDDIMKLANCAP